MLVWLYVWFYMAWGLNYFRYNIYTRLQVTPAVYDEHQFLSFLNTYTDSLNASYVIQKEVSEDVLEREVKSYYQNISASNGLVSPKSYQSPKIFKSLFIPHFFENDVSVPDMILFTQTNALLIHSRF